MPLSIVGAVLKTSRRLAPVLFAVAFFLVQTLLSARCLAQSLSNKTTSAVAEPNTLVYAGDENFAPYEFLDRYGNPAGLNIDLIRAVAKTQGIRVQIRLLPWTQVGTGIRRGEVDVASMYRSRQRELEFDFGIPFELIYPRDVH